MSGLAHLTVSSVLAIHEEVLSAHGGLPDLQDLGLLESAVAAPQASFGGEPLVTNPHEVAAAYLFHLYQNHPFNDGNKRTALAACLVFLVRNGLLEAGAHLDREAWETLVLGVAASQIGKDELVGRLRNLVGSPPA